MKACLALCAVLLLSGCGKTQGRAPEARHEMEADSAAARGVVTELGQRLRRVSLLAPESLVVASLRTEYGPLVVPELLDEWIRHPQSAPGRWTSSPWPDHIEVEAMTSDSSGTWVVRGAVVEAASTGPTGRAPVRLEVTRRGDRWLLGSYARLDLGEDDAASATATDVLRDYYRAISERRFHDAYRLWASEGAASGQTLERFEAGFSSTVAVEAEVGAPGPLGAAAGSRYIDVPVRIHSRLRDGTRREFAGTYTLRRSVVDGASAEQRAWRIHSAVIRRVR